MCMTDGARQRVGRIWFGHGWQIEQALDHLLHLFFFGMAIAHHRLFNLQRSVLRHRQFAYHHRANRRATRLAEQ